MENKPANKKNNPAERKMTWFLNKKEKEFFTENLALMLSSGMDILLALETIEHEAHTRVFRKAIKCIKEEIEEGSSLWESLEKTGALAPHIISLIKIGEQSGRLSQNLQIVALQQRKERGFISKLHSAMMYPILVICVAGVVGMGIAWFILPKLALVFSSLNLKLPLITRLLIKLGLFLQHYGYLAIPIFIGFIAVMIYFLFFFSRTKSAGQWLMYHFPGVRSVIQEVQVARLGYILGTLFDAGLPVLDSLSALWGATNYYSYRKMFGYWRGAIEEGHSFQECFEHYKHTDKYLPFVVQQIIVSGEKSGNLPKTFLNIGDIFEAKTENSAKNLSVILEPVLLVIVWLCVVAVALAVILPIYSLIGGIR